MTIILLILFLIFPSNAHAVNSGWDYNLTKKCIKSPNPSGVNYYQDITQCGSDNKNWTVAVQSEKSLGVSCGGVANQSLPINSSEGPVSLAWVPHTDENNQSNWKINLTTDLTNKTHPCGAYNFTWYTIQDNVSLNGGPLPSPDKLKTSISVLLDQTENSNVAIRNFIGWQGFWDGKSHSIEINFSLSNKWGDKNVDPDIIWTIDQNSTQDYIVMDGKALNIKVNNLENKTIDIKWIDIINDLIKRKYLSAPTGGWLNSATSSVFIGSEVNNFTATNAGKNTLSVTNFRNQEVEPGDFNQDSKIDMVDFAFWKSQYLKNLMTLADFSVWKKAYLLN